MKRKFAIASTILSLILCVITLLLWGDDEDKAREKQQAIDKVKTAYKKLIENRSLEYYVVQVSTPELDLLEKDLIKSGEVIIGGKALTAPYDVRCGHKAITINGISVVPSCGCVGDMKRYKFTEAGQKESKVAQLISDKVDVLYKELGDYDLVIPKLAAYAKTFGLVKEVRVEGNTVIVVFIPQKQGARPNEVGYICRKMRPGLSEEERKKFRTEVLLKEYHKICKWLKGGGCVFVSIKGDIKFERGGLVQKIDGIIDKEYDLDTKLRDCKTTLEATTSCFKNSITIEEAAAVLANWRRKLQKEPKDIETPDKTKSK